jgi:hypothetical protein
MAYGAEAVLPTILEYVAPRVKLYTNKQNESSLRDVLDQLDEARSMVLLGSARYQQALQRYHSCRVRKRSLHVGDLVVQWV